MTDGYWITCTKLKDCTKNTYHYWAYLEGTTIGIVSHTDDTKELAIQGMKAKGKEHKAIGGMDFPALQSGDDHEAISTHDLEVFFVEPDYFD